ncbi:alanine racemase [Chelativorans sp. M5D2P16]|uniref:alanine racemase n=1 Tax=Chelativorans sp. M5D2P16 TaxID=3095678 RepID=UPI002ACA1393|nr:alanine racemase [Chelativorans sp. M5D2P16]MDZ5696279.1 alanine racemase [Chelativorans sp. M5D2P16]
MSGSGPAPHLAGGRLTIDLDALADNYRLLAKRSVPAEASAVVKADAYGLGLAPVARTLWAAGCRRFFVALPHEGLALRAVLPEAQIFVFNGLFGTEAAAVYREARLVPVLNSQSDLSTWEAHGWNGEGSRPCAIHLETGMNRLGLTAERARTLAEENTLTRALTPILVMSHLACADAPDHPMNRRQCESFQVLRALFPEIESSLANSAGIFLGGDFLCDVTRPGIALYGGAPNGTKPNPMRQVVTAEARIAQVRRAKAGETVSYGATPLARDTIIAVASTGYADGYHRAASGGGVPLRAVDGGASGFFHGQAVPVLGRVTMDLTLFDVTDLGADDVAVGDHIELFGPNMPIDSVAAAAGTIAYELLTSLGQRYHREYVGGEA